MEQNRVDFIFINDLWKRLSKGAPSALSPDNILELNRIAMRIYDEKILDSIYIETLRYILMICNLLYNRTDMSVLPIEDGVYDLLMEKYKTYDSNFQVGSTVVDFKPTVFNIPEVKEVKPAIVKLDPMKKADDISLSIRNDIMRTGKPILNFDDLAQPATIHTSSYISKRTHTTEHNHPDLIGTLDKCKFVMTQDAINAGAINDDNVKILERDFFLNHIERGIIRPDQELDIVIELKYDGISVEADCTNTVISARTRGDTGVGKAADITPILYGYLFKHAYELKNSKPIGVKFEAIMTKSNLYNFNIARGNNYSNCRTAIIGLFGSSNAYMYRDYITLIPLALDRNDMPTVKDRIQEIEILNTLYQSNGEPLRYCIVHGNYIQCLFYIRKFFEEAQMARSYLDFMYDGIVVSYINPDICEKLGRKNYINKYSIAVKFNPLSKVTTFRYYTYEVGQNGQITPMLHYDPVEFLGTIHTKSTGSSLKRFQDLSLKSGDQILVTYVNDVMPYVTKPDCEYNRTNPNPYIEPPDKCPICGSTIIISDSGKTMSCSNMQCNGRKVSRMVNMLSKMNIKGFGESTIESIQVYSLTELMNLDEEYLAQRIGPTNASNLIQSLDMLKNTPIYDYYVIGSLGFSGIALLKWKNIFSKITLPELISSYDSDTLYEFLSSMKGIGDKTANVIISEMEQFIHDIRFINENFNIINSYNISCKKQIRFSGCRNQLLEEQLCNAGYDADSSLSVTKNTDILIVPYDGYISSKTKKAGDKCVIVPISEFIENMDFFLG